MPDTAYQHAEAFHLMTYRAADGAQEYVWNSRDGVTPFVITLRTGQEASHVDWEHDTRMPEDWQPPPGMRYFADLTPERARAHAEAAVDRYLADPDDRARLLHQFGDRDNAVHVLTASYLESPSAPDLIDPAERS
jgi:hypothetical protein